MQIEYEATFLDINKDILRQKLKEVGAILVRPEYIQKRRVFHLPEGHEIQGGWLRVRDEGDKITMSVKIVDGDKIENQKEVQLSVGDFDAACELVKIIGCQEKAYQVSKRELWSLNGTEVTIDEWPYLEPFVEIEGNSEDAVKQTAEVLGFEYSEAIFGAVDTLYAQKYGISKDQINNHTPVIDFDQSNPFV